MQESFWWWQCSDRYIFSLSPHLHTPFPPSLISLMVSVDVKHHVYFTYLSDFVRAGLWSCYRQHTNKNKNDDGITRRLDTMISSVQRFSSWRKCSLYAVCVAAIFATEVEAVTRNTKEEEEEEEEHTHTNTRTNARTHSRTHTRTHARTHAQTHTRTRTQTSKINKQKQKPKNLRLS